MQSVIRGAFPALCRIQGSISGRRVGGGSGFIISETGTLVTNDHVLSALLSAGCNEILASFDDGRVYCVEALASDKEADIAIARLLAPPGTRFHALAFASSDALVRGDAVVVLGAPLGGSLVPAVGVVGGNKHVADDELMTSVLRAQTDWSLLQVDANMSSGSSGGPILNAQGHVVGVSVLVQTTGGMGVGSLNYGVASDQVYPILLQLLRDGRVTRAAVGLDIVTLDRVTADKERANSGVDLLPPAPLAGGGSGEGYATGLLITHVLAGKPGETAGLEEGDVILEIDGERCTRKGIFFKRLGPVYVEGKRLNCLVWRPGKPGQGGKLLQRVLQPQPRGQVRRVRGTRG